MALSSVMFSGSQASKALTGTPSTTTPIARELTLCPWMTEIQSLCLASPWVWSSMKLPWWTKFQAGHIAAVVSSI